MLVVDTNVLIYAANRDYSEHGKCRALIEELRSDAMPWYITWPIVYEFLRVCTHPRVFRKPWATEDAWGFIRCLLSAPGLEVLVQTHRHEAVASGTLAEVPGLRGNLMHDTHTAVLMREHGIKRICTRDSDFHRFPFLDVVDPLVS